MKLDLSELHIIFGDGGKESHQLHERMLLKGFKVSLLNIRDDARAMSEFLGRGFTRAPHVLRRKDSAGLGNAEQVHLILDGLPDVRKPNQPLGPEHAYGPLTA